MKKPKPTILCIDDEEIVRESLKEQLKRSFGAEYRVEVVENGEAALELIEDLDDPANELPLVIADQIMPGLKGDETLIEVHRRLPRTLKVLLTGQASAEAVGNAVNQANLYRYIAKPWDREDLALTVREALRRYFHEQLLDEQNAELRSLNEMLVRRAEAFFRFVPRDFLRLLGAQDDYEKIDLGVGVDLELSVMFSDIRAFTTMAETMAPAECVDFINRYISAIEPALSEHGGFIEHIAGDGLLVLFDRGPDHAIRSAVELRRRLAAFNAPRVQAGLPPVIAGAGINVGRLTLGTLGSRGRLKCGVVGDPVNLAARVEGLTSAYNCFLLVTDTTVERMRDPEQFHARHVDTVIVKGRSSPVALMEIVEAEEPERRAVKLKTLWTYEDACAAFYGRRIDEATALFRKVLDLDPRDHAALRFLSRCEHLLESGIPDDWTGVTVFAHK